MLKGKTTIELTNVKTGETEKYEDENLVTNVISDIMTYNPFLYRLRSNGTSTSVDGYDVGITSLASTFTPVVGNLIGGIALFEDTLLEAPDVYFAPESNTIIGYSDNVVNTNDNPKRGSMNQTETKQYTDENGNKAQRFVFDFSTSQGNGKISSVGLTSRLGGRAMYGDNYFSYWSTCCFDNHQFYSSSASFANNTYGMQVSNIVSVDLDNNIGYFVRIKDSKVIEVGKVRIPHNNIGLFEDLGGSSSPYQVLEVKEINTENFGATYYKATSGSQYWRRHYLTFIKDDNNIIWGFEHVNGAQGNQTGDAKINWIKIDPSDWSFVENDSSKPVTLTNAQLYWFGRYYTPGKDGHDYSYYSQINTAIIKEGFLYALKYNGYGVYKISLSDFSFEFIDSAVSLYGINDYRYPTTWVNEVGNRICYERGFIENGTIVPKDYLDTYNSSVLGYTRSCTKPSLKYGPFLLGIDAYNYNGSRLSTVVILPMMYLATINNLASPVEKTADKTMKITYALTEIKE